MRLRYRTLQVRRKLLHVLHLRHEHSVEARHGLWPSPRLGGRGARLGHDCHQRLFQSMQGWGRWQRWRHQGSNAKVCSSLRPLVIHDNTSADLRNGSSASSDPWNQMLMESKTNLQGGTSRELRAPCAKIGRLSLIPSQNQAREANNRLRWNAAQGSSRPASKGENKRGESAPQADSLVQALANSLVQVLALASSLVQVRAGCSVQVLAGCSVQALCRSATATQPQQPVWLPACFLAHLSPDCLPGAAHEGQSGPTDPQAPTSACCAPASAL